MKWGCIIYSQIGKNISDLFEIYEVLGNLMKNDFKSFANSALDGNFKKYKTVRNLFEINRSTTFTSLTIIHHILINHAPPPSYLFTLPLTSLEVLYIIFVYCKYLTFWLHKRLSIAIFSRKHFLWSKENCYRWQNLVLSFQCTLGVAHSNMAIR